jgi:hypothetical protein
VRSNSRDSNIQKNDVKSFDLESSGAFSPVLGSVQDHPAAWDWRLIVAFVALGIAALYLF